jgi:hypothetical protein
MALYLACDLDDYTPATGECAAPYFTEVAPPSGSVLPPLTIEEGTAIAVAILGVWAVAYAFRAVIRALKTID